jgi:dTDP-4-dehydrorhamnose 3,5-epimerase
LHTSAYHSDAEGALNVTDPALSIDWPLPVIDLSKRDQNHPFVNNINFKGITL